MYNNKEYTFDRGHFNECKIGRIFGVKTKEFKYNVGDIIKDDKRDLKIIKVFRNKNGKRKNCKWYKYHCNKCGNEDNISEGHLTSSEKRGCNRCNGNHKVDETNCVATTHPHLMKYLVNEEDGYKYRFYSLI